MTNTERIDELEETIQELQETINSLTEDNASLEETIDELREEVSQQVENFALATKQMNTVTEQMKRFINMSYTYDRQQDTLQVQAHISRDMLEYGGPEALDMVYQNMKDQLTDTFLKKPYKYPNNIKYNPPAVW
jgi:chromosome segregation ATPase